MKTEEEIRERYEEIQQATKQSKTVQEKLYHYGRLALLEWVLEE